MDGYLLYQMDSMFAVTERAAHMTGRPWGLPSMRSTLCRTILIEENLCFTTSNQVRTSYYLDITCIIMLFVLCTSLVGFGDAEKIFG